MVVSSLLLVMFSFWWHYHHDSSLPMVTSLSHGNIPPLVTLSRWQLLSYGDVTLCNDSSLSMVASSPLLVMFFYWWYYHSDSSLPMVTSLSLDNVPPWWHYHSDSSLPMVMSLFAMIAPFLWWRHLLFFSEKSFWKIVILPCHVFWTQPIFDFKEGLLF